MLIPSSPLGVCLAILGLWGPGGGLGLMRAAGAAGSAGAMRNPVRRR
jgi:hypothetical protein